MYLAEKSPSLSSTHHSSAAVVVAKSLPQIWSALQPKTFALHKMELFWNPHFLAMMQPLFWHKLYL